MDVKANFNILAISLNLEDFKELTRGRVVSKTISENDVPIAEVKMSLKDIGFDAMIDTLKQNLDEKFGY